MKLDCLILAAGNSSRFGGCKLLAEWQGRPLIAASISAAIALAPARILVLAGAFYSQLLDARQDFTINASAFELLEYRDWALGMGHSLAYGIQQLDSNNAVLILLADQPLISGQDLKKLYQSWCLSPDKIACANFSNTLGVPAIFPESFKTHLQNCCDNQGAKKIIYAHINQVIPVAIPTAEFDIDTPDDLILIIENQKNYTNP